MIIDYKAMKNPVVRDIFKRVAAGGNVDLACAEHTVAELDNIEFKSIPDKTKEVVEYEKIPYEVRRNFRSDYYKEANPTVLPYYDLADKVRRDNASIYDWLIYCIKLLHNNPAAMLKIHNKLDDVTVDMVWTKEKRYAGATRPQERQARTERRDVG